MRLVASVAAFLVSCFAAQAVHAEPMRWPDGKRAAVVLTYDDALLSQLENALPQLDAAGLKGTFFLEADNLSPERVERWRAASAEGHELGNHSLFHPCPRAMLPQSIHVTDDYTPAAMVAEIKVMNALLFALDGRASRNLAYPCSQTMTGGGDYTEALKASGQVRYARTGGDPYRSVVTDFAQLDQLKIPSNGPTDHPGGAELTAYVDRVRDAGGLGILQFHGVGGDYLDVSSEAHQVLVSYLAAHPDVWVATFGDVMTYVDAHRAGR